MNKMTSSKPLLKIGDEISYTLYDTGNKVIKAEMLKEGVIYSSSPPFLKIFDKKSKQIIKLNTEYPEKRKGEPNSEFGARLMAYVKTRINDRGLDSYQYEYGIMEDKDFKLLKRARVEEVDTFIFSRETERLQELAFKLGNTEWYEGTKESEANRFYLEKLQQEISRGDLTGFRELNNTRVPLDAKELAIQRAEFLIKRRDVALDGSSSSSSEEEEEEEKVVHVISSSEDEEEVNHTTSSNPKEEKVVDKRSEEQIKKDRKYFTYKISSDEEEDDKMQGFTMEAHKKWCCF